MHRLESVDVENNVACPRIIATLMYAPMRRAPCSAVTRRRVHQKRGPR